MKKNLTLTPVIIVTCNLLVRMMLGYMAPTSRWYMMGFSSLLGQSLNMDRLSMMSAHTSSKFVTSSIGIFSSTSIACFIVLSTLSIRFWNASGTYMYVLINFNIFSTFSIPLSEKVASKKCFLQNFHCYKAFKDFKENNYYY